MIYFIQDEEQGPVKIGRAFNERARLTDLQVGNPRELQIRAALDEPDQVERYFHDLLAPYRVRGEWFRTDSLVPLCVLACAHAGFVCPEDVGGGLATGPITGRSSAGTRPRSYDSAASKLSRWLSEYCRDTGSNKVPLKVPRQYGPVRDKEQFWAAINELAESGAITPADEGRQRFIVVTNVASGVPVKKSWSRESYNAYMREYMRNKRANA